MRAIKGICACAVSLALAGVPAVPIASADEAPQDAGSAVEGTEGGSASEGASGADTGGASAKDGGSKPSGSKAKDSKGSSSKKDSSAKKGSKSAASKSSKSSKDAAGKDASESMAKKDAKQAKKAAKLLKKARSAKKKADAAAGKIAGPRAELETASGSLADARDKLLALQDKESALAEKLEAAGQRASDVEAVLASAENMLRSHGVATLAAELPCIITSGPDAEGGLPVDEMPGSEAAVLDASIAAQVARLGLFELLDRPAEQEAAAERTESYALERVVDGLGGTLAKAQKREGKLGKREKKLKKRIKSQAKAQSATIAAGNKNAFAIEKHASDSRVFDRRAQEAADKLDGSDSASAGVIESVSASKERHNTVREEAAQVVGAWYDLVDSFSDREDAISFGEGVDFLMDRDEFVAKWGSAIEKFYEGRVSEEGVHCPLKDHADYMAGCAYDSVIDPRLCAAVSIIESSGGVYCIRPHNAWGWGAADSDPYNLAAEWGSWEEAIKAWHEGVAHSTTGLADAATLDEFGEIYCSSAAWSADVAKCMQKISDYANA